MLPETTPAPRVAVPSARAAGWKSWNVRMCPAVRRALKADAALAGTTAERRLHHVLTEHLTRRGILPVMGEEGR